MNTVSSFFKDQYDRASLAMESTRRFVEEFPYELNLGYFLPSSNASETSIHIKDATPDMMNEMGFVLKKKGEVMRSVHATWVNCWKIDSYAHPGYPALTFCVHTDWIESVPQEEPESFKIA